MRKIERSEAIFEVEGFLSSEECDDFLARVAVQEFEEAKINMDGKQTLFRAIRNNERILFSDHALADDLWMKIQPFIGNRIGSYKPKGLNEMFRKTVVKPKVY